MKMFVNGSGNVFGKPRKSEQVFQRCCLHSTYSPEALHQSFATALSQTLDTVERTSRHPLLT